MSIIFFLLVIWYRIFLLVFFFKNKLLKRFHFLYLKNIIKVRILMETTQEKISLLKEMIAFALVDGELHDREYDFIEIVAYELGVDKETLHKLYEYKGEVKVIKDEINRICQFYRLALLMRCDDVLHERERVKINEIGINMGLDPYAMKRVLRLIEDSPNHIVDPHTLIKLFSEQLN